MATAWLDTEAIRGAFRRGAEDALDEIGDAIAADAKRRAPIRKVFKETKRRKFRPLTQAERTQAIQRAEDYYTRIQPDEFKRRRAVAHLRFYARAEVPRRGMNNNLTASRKLRVLGFREQGRFRSTSGSFPNRKGGFEPGEQLKPLLTKRGRYEVRSGRAIHEEGVGTGTRSRVQVGGALKASIGNTGVRETGSGVVVNVVAAIRYAKYVEFPTIRTAAQPFLLPALKGQQARLPRLVAEKIRQQLGG